MTGKARSNDESFEAYQLPQNAKFENFLAQNTNIDHGQFFTSPPPQRDLRTFLNKESGGVMGSPIGYNPSIVTISSGIIDIGRSSNKLSSHVIIQAESGTADTLTDIQNFVFSYQDLTIQADTGDTITVSTGGTTGSDIFLGTGISSITLNSTEQLQLRYDIVANRWATFIDTTSGGSGDASDWANFTAASGVNFGGFASINMSSLTMAGNIDVNTFDVLQIDRATFADDSSSITGNAVTQMVLNSTGSFQTNTATGNDFVWTINNTTIATFDVDASSNGLLTIQSPDSTGGAVINVFRNDIDGGISATTAIGSFGFTTGTTLLNAVAEYASFSAVAEDVTTLAWKGSLDVNVANGSGAQETFMSFNDGANDLVDIFKELDVNLNDILRVDRLTFGANSGVLTSTAVNQIVLNTTNSLQFNGATSIHDFVFTLAGDTIATIDNDTSNNGVFTIQSLDDTGGGVVNVFRNDIDGGISATTVIGSFGFTTGTTLLNAVAEYASFSAVAEDVTTLAWKGSLDVNVANGSGGQEIFMSFNDGVNDLVDIFKELDMNNNQIVNVSDPTSDQDAATKKYVDDNAGGSQTPWISDIDAAGFDLDNLGFIEFNASAIGSSSQVLIGYNGTNLRFNVPTTKGFIWSVEFSQVFGLGSSIVNCFQEMDMNTNQINNVVDPTSDQDAATKKYVDDSTSGTQPFYVWEEHETDQFDFEVYMSNSMQGGHDHLIFLTEDQVYYVPFFISTTSNIVRMGIQVEFVTGSYNLEFAVYSNRTDGQNYPETRLDVVSSILTAGTGTSTLPLTNSVTLTPGLYWFAVLCNNNSTLEVSAVTEGHGNCVGYTNDGASGFNQVLSYTEAGALNDTAADENTSINTAPLIFAKFNSTT